MYLLTDDEIYQATETGFHTKVEANNLTDEIELKRHEGAKEVARQQLGKVVDLMISKNLISYVNIDGVKQLLKEARLNTS